MLDTGWPPLKLDQRNRLGLPPVARVGVSARSDGSIEFAVGVLPGLDPACIWIMTDEQYRAFLDRLDERLGDARDDRMISTFTRASFQRVATDNQGRMSLPLNLMEQAGIKERVTLVGKRDRLEVWASETFDDTRTRLAEELGQGLESFFRAETERKKQSDALGRPAVGPFGEGRAVPADIPAGR